MVGTASPVEREQKANRFTFERGSAKNDVDSNYNEPGAFISLVHCFRDVICNGARSLISHTHNHLAITETRCLHVL